MQPIRILIVEDFHGDTEILEVELAEAELLHTPLVVSTHEDFEREVVDFEPDVVLCPYSLQETNALKLLQIARNSGCEVPFILLAYDLSEDIAIDLLAEGIEDYILRSTVKRLPVAIRKALQRYRIQLELQLSEAKLRASETSLREAQKIARVGSWEWVMDREEVQWSEETFRIYEFKGTRPTLQDVYSHIHPEDHNRTTLLTRHTADDIFHPQLKYRLLLPSGKVKHVISRARPVLNGKGELVKLIGTLQDVTEQIRAQKDLEAKTLQRDLILSMAKIGVWHWEVGNKKLMWDENCARLFEGFESKLETEKFYDLVHPDDREYVRERLIDGLKTGDYSAEYRLKSEDRTIFVISRGKATLGSEGRANRIDGIVIDMTERHQLQEARQQSEALFRDMAESISEVFWLKDRHNGKVLYVSPRYASLHETTVDELYADSDSWAKRIHPDDMSHVKKQFEEHAITGKFDVEYRLVMGDGTIKWVRDRAFPVYDKNGNVTRVAGIAEEITDRKRDKERIQTLSQVASEAGNGVLIQDANGAVIWTNKGFSEISGYAPHEIVGKEPWTLLAGEEPDRNLINSTYEQLKKGISLNADYRIFRKNGTPFWIHASFSPIMDAKGSLKQIVSIGTDITRSKLKD